MAIWRGLEVASLENCENYLDISLTPLNVTPRCQQHRTSSADLLRHEDAICAGGEAGSPPPPDFSPSRRRLCVVHGVSTVLSPASDPNLTATPLSTTQMADHCLGAWLYPDPPAPSPDQQCDECMYWIYRHAVLN